MAELSIRGTKINVEVPVLFLFFAFNFGDSVTTNLVIYKTCLVTLGYNETDCALLGKNYSDNATAQLEKLVQPHATVIFMTRTFVEALIPPVLCFFIGPWSDKYGRKPVMLTGLAGFLASLLIIAVNSFFRNISPWYLLLSSIPICLTGGFAAFFSAILCYITDRTSEENRGMRMAVLEGILTLGMLIGSISTSYVFNASGYLTVYSICAGCILISFLYTALLIPESIIEREPDGVSFRKLFHLGYVKDSLATIFTRRENNNRTVLLMVIMTMVIYILIIFADGSIIFLFLREKFHWSLQKFNLYSSARNLGWLLGSVGGVYFLHKLLHIEEAILIIVGFLSVMSGSLIQGLATKDVHIYIAGGSKSLGGLISPMARSLISKIVPVEETGKLFSIIAALESVTGLIGAPLYTAIYNNTLATMPEAFNFVGAGVYVLEIILISVVYFIQRSHSPTYEELSSHASTIN